MRFRISHRTTYHYTKPVYLESHEIRLRPRVDASQQLHRFEMRVTPEPAGVTHLLNAEGNVTLLAWFSGLTSKLSVEVQFEAETLRTNPFDFILTDPAAQQLPVRYPPPLERILAASRRPPSSLEVRSYADRLAAQGVGSTLEFLDRLCRDLYQRTQLVIRHHGRPYPPAKTLGLARGSCRDLAVLFLAACRAQGLAARFVSGYQEGDPDMDRRDLHAWAEVFLPGGGWRGYDPTHGLAVADRHLVVAASADPALAAPVSGSFRGDGARGQLDFDLSLETC